MNLKINDYIISDKLAKFLWGICKYWVNLGGPNRSRTGVTAMRMRCSAS